MCFLIFFLHVLSLFCSGIQISCSVAGLISTGSEKTFRYLICMEKSYKVAVRANSRTPSAILPRRARCETMRTGHQDDKKLHMRYFRIAPQLVISPSRCLCASRLRHRLQKSRGLSYSEAARQTTILCYFFPASTAVLPGMITASGAVLPGMITASEAVRSSGSFPCSGMRYP